MLKWKLISVCLETVVILMWVMWNLVSVHLEIVLVSVQDRCTVCAERTISSEIIYDTPDGTPRWREPYGTLFWSVWR
jgi:hypothetical protein